MYILSKERWVGDGRTFGTVAEPIKYLYVFLADDILTDTIPVSDDEIAPGSLFLDISDSTKYFWNGTQPIAWEG